MRKMTTRPPGLIEGVANKRTLFHGRSFWTRLGSWYSRQEKQNRNKLTVTNFEDQQIMTTGAAAAHCQCPYCLQILNIICHPGSKLYYRESGIYCFQSKVAEIIDFYLPTTIDQDYYVSGNINN